MISINATLVVQVLHFLLLLFVMNRLLLRPIMDQIRDREAYLQKAKRDSEEMAAEAERIAEKRLAMEREARQDAAKQRAGLKEQAMAEADGIFEETSRKIRDIRDRIRAQVQEQVEQAQRGLDQEAAALAEEIVERIAGRRVGR
jgi:F-type H+-transporting ATPase subunit b